MGPPDCGHSYIATVRPVSTQVVPSLQMNDTQNVLAVVVPVASVAVTLKLVLQVSVKLDVPLVVTMNVQRAPAFPPEPLNVQAPVGVIVVTPSPLGIVTVIVPVVAEVAAVADTKGSEPSERCVLACVAGVRESESLVSLPYTTCVDEAFPEAGISFAAEVPSVGLFVRLLKSVVPAGPVDPVAPVAPCMPCEP